MTGKDILDCHKTFPSKFFWWTKQPYSRCTISSCKQVSKLKALHLKNQLPLAGQRALKSLWKRFFFQYNIFIGVIYHLKILCKTNEALIFCCVGKWLLCSSDLAHYCIPRILKSFKGNILRQLFSRMVIESKQYFFSLMCLY